MGPESIQRGRWRGWGISDPGVGALLSAGLEARDLWLAVYRDAAQGRIRAAS
ncbi:MAG TPA: hypothetical protein VHB01_08555 [Nitrosospira sp.]|nr:hypothetical protein [Nitrosospira sp.]